MITPRNVSLPFIHALQQSVEKMERVDEADEGADEGRPDEESKDSSA